MALIESPNNCDELIVCVNWWVMTWVHNCVINSPIRGWKGWRSMSIIFDGVYLLTIILGYWLLCKNIMCAYIFNTSTIEWKKSYRVYFNRLRNSSDWVLWLMSGFYEPWNIPRVVIAPQIRFQKPKVSKYPSDEIFYES